MLPTSPRLGARATVGGCHREVTLTTQGDSLEGRKERILPPPAQDTPLLPSRPGLWRLCRMGWASLGCFVSTQRIRNEHMATFPPQRTGKRGLEMELRDTRLEGRVLSSTPVPPLGHRVEDHKTLSSKTPSVVGEAGMKTTQQSASQAGQGVENEEASFLGEKRPEGSHVDVQQ